MMARNYNMFNVQLKDFNSTLEGFLVANSRNLSSDITELVQNFIKDLGQGPCFACMDTFKLCTFVPQTM